MKFINTIYTYVFTQALPDKTPGALDLAKQPQRVFVQHTYPTHLICPGNVLIIMDK